MPDSAHLKAVLQALLVTFVWSASWVLIKIGLEDIPPLTFAGMRYTLAFLALLPLALRAQLISTARTLSRRQWLFLITLGLLFYTVTQGGQFVVLVYLPAATYSLLLNFTAVLVAFMGIAFLGERVAGRQWLGLLLFLGGVFIFFYPPLLPAAQIAGYVLAVITVVANAAGAVLGRVVNRSGTLTPLAVTTISMGIGSVVMLAIGLLVEPFPALGWQQWLIVVWLAVVHTAFTFTLWNQTLRTLSATESSVINNMMMIQIPILAWIFLGEALTRLEIAGLLLAAAGIFLFQIRTASRKVAARTEPKPAPVGAAELAQPHARKRESDG